ncbi:hypothetical protein Clacol_000145 [Clathrus columnatus]|uniref:Acyl-CoA dehydrogenase NM domain-like protein n=1 Tax=Clathrus columnatus TaxID=1419009 RepID=A0AAV4ZXX8_9AGAM|nr:hypothetical protein Clacol_000145 [Clathrus columnatus]
MALDGSVATLLTIQYNLCLGTLATFGNGRSDVEKIISEVLDYRISGQFCLTEINHGLNAINIETSATLQPNGEFLLHTPHPGAAKYMPPTCPFGIPCIAIILARLIVDGDDYGIRGFIVKLHDGFKMTPGNLEKPRSIRESFFENIQRVISGTLSMGAVTLPALRIGCYIGTAYSLRRQVLDPSTRTMRPISSFSTQYIPLLTSIARTLVFCAFGQEMYERFVDPSISSPSQKHFVASVFKTTVYRHTAEIILQLGDRCGAQGLFAAEVRGAAIAEGDILGISIRFAIDTLRGKVELYEPKYPDHLIAQHEQSIINELRLSLLQSKDHRSIETERMLLPHCRGVLEAIGHRWAYEAAVSRGVSQPIIDLFEASLFELDPAWYSENGGISRWEQKSLLLERATALYEDLPQFLKLLDVEDYVTAPIVSKERWEKYVMQLPVFVNDDEPSTTLLVSHHVDITSPQNITLSTRIH